MWCLLGSQRIKNNGVGVNPNSFVLRGPDGPLDTLSWEGYRDGCDDARYLATPEDAIAKARSAGIADPGRRGPIQAVRAVGDVLGQPRSVVDVHCQELPGRIVGVGVSDHVPRPGRSALPAKHDIVLLAPVRPFVQSENGFPPGDAVRRGGIARVDRVPVDRPIVHPKQLQLVVPEDDRRLQRRAFPRMLRLHDGITPMPFGLVQDSLHAVHPLDRVVIDEQLLLQAHGNGAVRFFLCRQKLRQQQDQHGRASQRHRLHVLSRRVYTLK